MDRALNLLGLATRANKTRSGAALAEKTVKSGEACLLLIAGDCSENTMDKFCSMADYYEVEYKIFASRELLGKFTGGGEKSVVTVLDHGFKEAIIKLL